MEAEGKVFVIRPSRHIEVGRLEQDADRLRALHALGVDDALGVWEQLESYLHKDGI